MIIYSFDVGDNTGICIAGVESESIVLTTIPVSHLSSFLNLIVSPCEVIVERMPKYNNTLELKMALNSIEVYCEEFNIPITLISPSTWKPIAKAQKWMSSLAKTDHELDAYCLYRYYRKFIRRDLQ